VKKKMSRNEQILLVVLLGVIGVFTFTKKVYDPLTKEITDLVKKSNIVVTEINEMMKKLENEDRDLKRFKKQVAESERVLDSIQPPYDSLVLDRVVDRTTVDKTVLEITEMASEHGISLLEFVPDSAAGSSGGKTADTTTVQKSTFLSKSKSALGLTQYSLRAEGDYLDIVDFYQKLTTRRYVLAVGEMKIVKKPGDEFIQTGMILFDCSIIF